VCLPVGENLLGLYDIWLSSCWPFSLFNCNTLLGFTKKVSCSCQQPGRGEIWTLAKGQGKRVTTASSIYFERRRPRRSTIRNKNGKLDVLGLPAISQGRISRYFCIHSRFVRLYSQVPHNLGLSVLRPHPSSDAISDSKPRREDK
jgi:hypothetical protein